MSAALATAPRVRTAAECRADEIEAAYRRCTTAQHVYRVLDRAVRSIDWLRELEDQDPFRRADAARAEAFRRCVPPPQALPPDGAHAAAERQMFAAMADRAQGAAR